MKSNEVINSGSFSHIVVTDIADYYPSIYLHNIETHLRECVRNSGKSAHAEVLINAIKAMHSNQTHKGLPIGPQLSRPIAELLLNEVDKIIIINGVFFFRYVDDYRIFCKSESEAYKYLAFLAQKLYDVLNLKLNEQKTKILENNYLEERFVRTFRQREEDQLLKNFYQICSDAGISMDFYDEVDIDLLDEDIHN